tara:strand:+ start:176 stop:430 length:255 start_codon:yes stop_codon:yes gene_type:complete
MAGMFQKKKSNTNATQNLKSLLADKFRLDDETIISIAELSCHEPDCPPIETVVTFRQVDGKTKSFKIHKPIDKIQLEDLNNIEY